MVPMQMGTLEHDVGNDTKDCQRDALLNHLQLNEVEGTAVLYEANAVGRHLTAVLKEGDAPRESNHPDKRPVVADPRLL